MPYTLISSQALGGSAIFLVQGLTGLGYSGLVGSEVHKRGTRSLASRRGGISPGGLIYEIRTPEDVAKRVNHHPS